MTSCLKVTKKQLTYDLDIEIDPLKNPSKLSVIAYIKHKPVAWLTFDVIDKKVVLDNYTGTLSVDNTLRVIKATEKYINKIVAK